MPFHAETESKAEYTFFPAVFPGFRFTVRADHDAHIALSPVSHETDTIYEIFIGGWENSKCAIRRNKQKPDVEVVNTPNILNASENKQFWITWQAGRIALGVEGSLEPFIVHSDPSLFHISHFGIRTYWGAVGSWDIDELWLQQGPPPGPQPYIQTGGGSTGGGSLRWITLSDGQVPPDAVEGGFDNERIFVGRVNFQGSLTPAKIVPSHNTAYVAWGGKEHSVKQYEVLCGSNLNWVPTSGTNIPLGSFPGGQSEAGEQLFIGRANYMDTKTVGKVQPSHGCCYIPYGGEEVRCDNYEILIAL